MFSSKTFLFSWDGSQGSPRHNQNLGDGQMNLSGSNGIAPSPARPPLPDHLLLPPPSVPPPSVHSQELDERSYTPCLIERAPSRLGSDAGPGQEGPGDGMDHPGEGEHSTLLQNEEESFALAPVDASILKGTNTCSHKFFFIININ